MCRRGLSGYLTQLSGNPDCLGAVAGLTFGYMSSIHVRSVQRAALRCTVLGAFLLFAAAAAGQSPPPHEPDRRASHPPRADAHHDLATARASFEAMASDVFRTVTAVVPIANRLAGEVHVFAIPDRHARVNVAQAGVSYQLALGGIGYIAPGFGYYSGVNHATASATVRWLVETGPLVSEGLLVQGIDASDQSETGQFWDGNHVSIAMLRRRLELGPTWEHIHIRDEDEWKWGARAALRVHERALLQLYVLTPGATEWRAGVVVR